MSQTIGYISLLVRDYDEAISFYTTVLGFMVVEDKQVASDKRWVLISPPGRTPPSLLLAKAATPEQRSRVGNQTGGRVFLFLHTEEFQRDYHDLKARGVRFLESPREESYGTVAVFEDLYGNKWDLLKLRNHSRSANE